MRSDLVVAEIVGVAVFLPPELSEAEVQRVVASVVEAVRQIEGLVRAEHPVRAIEVRIE